VPSKIIFLLLLTYRYIFVIDEEYKRLARSAKIRGFRPGTNLHTYKTYAYFVGMLFVRASTRAERVHQAMLCRGFRGRFHCLGEFSFSRMDWIFSLIMGGVITGLGYFEWIKTL
jgi:cobalt/nickel transport system permease protein